MFHWSDVLQSSANCGQNTGTEQFLLWNTTVTTLHNLTKFQVDMANSMSTLNRVSMAVKTLFKKYPMASNAVVYGTLITGAEFTQQTITKKILVKTSHRQPIDTGSLGRYAIMGTLIYPNVLYIWYQSFRISYQASNPHKMDQFSQNNKHTTLILELWRSYGHSATVILNFVSD